MLAAAAICATAPAAGAQTLGLYADGTGVPATAPAKSSSFVDWLTARPAASASETPVSEIPVAGAPVAGAPKYGVAPAGYLPGPEAGAATTVGYEVPCTGEAACESAPRRAPLHGLVPDGCCPPTPAAKPIYPPGTRQKESGGLQWPPYPRSTAPKASIKTQFHHAHYWPLPYSCQDRAYVRALSGAQVAAGRAEHAALYGFHFDPETHLLTGAGRDHLRTAAVAAASAGAVPPIVVASGSTPEVGAARLAAVRDAVAEMGVPQLAAAVSLGVIPDPGRPAEEIDRLRRDELQSTPAPRIPVASVGAGPAGS
ncbi:hypothetical protein [Alienimonas californiensis]|uniref:hypothetical protein n=1 Tax=Alienimonas californiensis TaxID=2527989 RepID=UPI0011AA3961|nr:hypothetical protein [Alienimonas californiensis]